MPKLVKATDAERRAYKGIYPLSHFVTVDGQRLPVEYLGGAWSKEDPQYEVMAPVGHHFKYDETHSLLCLNLADVRERTTGAVLEACGEACSL